MHCLICDPAAGELGECPLDGQRVFMADEQTTGTPRLGVGAFDDETAFLVPQFAAVVVQFLLVAFAIWNEPATLPSLTYRAAGWCSTSCCCFTIETLQTAPHVHGQFRHERTYFVKHTLASACNRTME